MIKLTCTFFLFIFSHGLCSAQADATHKIAPELAGKWCYISRSASTLENITSSCITLNADGTYEWQLDRAMMAEGTLPGTQNSDAGKWWVSGNIIFYESDSEGKGSIVFQKANHPRIEGTPALIVQGLIFCSPTPRDPW